MNKMIKLLRNISLITYILLLTSHAYANDCLEMRVIAIPPLGYLDENQKITGIHWDYLSALEQRSGLCFNKKLLPYPRIWESLEHGRHDASLVFRSSDRDSFVEYVAPIFTLRTVVMPRKGIIVQEYEDLWGLRIGKLRGNKLAPEFDNNPSLSLIEVNHYQQAWERIIRKRLDAVAGSEVTLRQSGQNIIPKYIDEENTFVLGENVIWLQFSKQSKQLSQQNKLAKAINELTNEGLYLALIEKHQDAIKK